MKWFVLAFALLPVASHAEVKVERFTYRNWSDSFRISNGIVDAVVVPKIGRVMRYGFEGKDNLLWENPEADPAKPDRGWVNYGGDKLWPAPQSVWNWPPDPDLDGAAWTAETIPNGVRITSPISRKMKIRLVREITLEPLGTQVHFRNRLDNLGERRELAPWQVTQVDDPYSIFLPFEATAQNPRGWRLLAGSSTVPSVHELTPTGLRIRRSPTAAYKFGAYSPIGEITSSKGQTVFSTSTKVYPRQKYSDGGSPLQVFTSGNPLKYAELELLGPLNRMENGEGAILEVTWKLSPAK